MPRIIKSNRRRLKYSKKPPSPKPLKVSSTKFQTTQFNRKDFLRSRSSKSLKVPTTVRAPSPSSSSSSSSYSSSPSPSPSPKLTRKRPISESVNQVTPFHQGTLPLTVISNIESFHDPTVALYQKNQAWPIVKSHIIRQSQIKNLNLVDDVSQFMPRLERFLDTELKEIVYKLDPYLDPALQYIKSANIIDNYEDILVTVVLKINNVIYNKRYFYHDGKFHEYLTATDIIDANLRMLHENDYDVFYFLERDILQLWVYSNCPYITNIFEDFNDNGRPTHKKYNQRIQTAINSVYHENGKDIKRTVRKIKRYIIENERTNRALYIKNDKIY